MASNLKIVPVIDILNGKAVHAVRGRRSEYQPLKSVLCESADPLEVAKSFRKMGFGELYVADLDAIIDCSEDFTVLRHVTSEADMKLMVDAGVTAMQRAESLLESGVSTLVIGTETLQKKSFVAQAVNAFGASRVIVSLDLKGDKVITRPGFDGSADALRLLREFEDMGVSQVIVLDLARVGSGEGVNVEFLKKTLQTVGMAVYVGGGVRNIADLAELKSLGVIGVLVASALHSGKISIDALRRAGLL